MRVLLASDQAMLRDGLQQSLLSHGETRTLIATADSWAAALGTIRSDSSLSVVVVDLDMAGFSFPQAIAELRGCGSALPMVAISASDDPQRITAVLHGGAAGYVPKSASCPVLWGAIGLASAGGMYLPPQLLRRPEPTSIVPQPALPPFGAYAGLPPPDLTRRQADVLRLMAQGKPNKVISRELGIASGTVKAHVTALLRALRVNNRTEAVSAILKSPAPSPAPGYRPPARLN